MNQVKAMNKRIISDSGKCNEEKVGWWGEKVEKGHSEMTFEQGLEWREGTSHAEYGGSTPSRRLPSGHSRKARVRGGGRRGQEPGPVEGFGFYSNILGSDGRFLSGENEEICAWTEGILESSSILEAPETSALLLSKGPERLCSPRYPSPEGARRKPVAETRLQKGCLACDQFTLVATIEKQLGRFKYNPY